MHTPLFWLDGSFPSRLLQPAAALYRAGSVLRDKARRERTADAPVICVGNLVAGGAGKTPVTLALADIFKNNGKRVFLLTRGHRGKSKGPLLVDAQRHHARDVGDEALLLAETAPTVMAKRRSLGAKLAAQEGAQVIIMDDGFQNKTIRKDFSLLVVDGRYGFGNGRLIPAGPLREPPEEGFARADAFVLIGEDRHNLLPQLASHHPVLRADMEFSQGMSHLKNAPVVAFAGIGRPEKFFQALRDYGCTVKDTTGFPDHHRFREAELRRLKELAKRREALLVTTHKDYVRIPEAWREGILPVSAKLRFADEAALTRLLAPYLG
jgi:tetraacyldisaccharide 4'-kinase